MSGGDGASFNFVDYGQGGGTPARPPEEPVRRPAGGVGGRDAADGRGRRAPLPGPPHDRRSDRSLDGSIIRVDPETGAALPDNPLAGERRPERAADHRLRPAQPVPLHLPARARTSCGSATSAGTTGRRSTGSPTPTDAAVENFGWPCYEGDDRQAGYDGANLALCESLYAQGPARDHDARTSRYNHAANVVAGETLPDGRLVDHRSRVLPDSGGSFPAAYQGALFFADHTRNCIWFIPKGANGQPDLNQLQVFLRRRQPIRSTS